MEKIRLGKGKSRSSKGQIFSLDVLVSLVPIILLLGASLQYLFEVQEKTKFISEDYELELLARSTADFVITKYNNSLDCARYASDVDFLLNENYEYYISANYYQFETGSGEKPAGKRSCGGIDMWSAGLDADSLAHNKNTTSSWKRFVLGTFDGHLNPGNITEVSIAVWEK